MLFLQVALIFAFFTQNIHGRFINEIFIELPNSLDPTPLQLRRLPSDFLDLLPDNVLGYLEYFIAQEERFIQEEEAQHNTQNNVKPKVSTKVIPLKPNNNKTTGTSKTSTKVVPIKTGSLNKNNQPTKDTKTVVSIPHNLPPYPPKNTNIPNRKLPAAPGTIKTVKTLPKDNNKIPMHPNPKEYPDPIKEITPK